jgi:4-amino-4-deoxy-L-arabinose transferase-like glycosyltransferase
VNPHNIFPSESVEQSRTTQLLDPLLVALSLAFLFCLQGITWGRVEDWNRSRIAMRGLRALRPSDYMKPPFHTYLNHVLVVWPITGVMKIAKVPTERMKISNSAKLIGSRLVTIALYLGTIALSYTFSRRSYGRFSAAIIAFAFATSAGFVAYAHFLTVDIPLLFWMMAALGATYRLPSAPSTWNYAIAGFLIGIAIATKYNGLAVGIALLVAHFFATKGESLQRIILSRQLGIGLGMVLVGFLFGCPTALYEPKRFWHDFIYNYTVTPRYEGEPNRANYLGAVGRIPEIIGIPGAILIASLAILSCILILRRRDFSDAAMLGFALSSAVFVLYILKVGTFPRTEMRYVLPAISFLILMIGPALHTFVSRMIRG